MADRAEKVIFIIFLLIFVLPYQTNSSIERLPNVILLVVDNLGLSDLGCFGNTSVKTPNIDKLANEGVRFTRWYGQSSSTSTRAALLTGKLPIRTGIIKSRYLPYKALPSLASSGALQLDETTLAEVLKGKGYLTAYVGQWGLGVGRKGKFLPIHQGFDRWYGVPGLHHSFCVWRAFNKTRETLLDSYESPVKEYSTLYLVVVFFLTAIIAGIAGLWAFKKVDTTTFVFLAAPVILLLYLAYFSVHLMDFLRSRNCILYRDGTIIEQPYTANNLTLRFTRETVNIINAFSAKKTPFFIMQSYLKMHQPFYLSHAFSNCRENDLFLCSLMELDWSVGVIIRTLEDLELENDTLLILTSSSGHCVDSNKICEQEYGSITNDKGETISLKSGGNNIWEGDIRIPTILRWKGELVPGLTINVTTTSMDLMPSLMELTNQRLDLESDGKSLVPLLVNSSAASQHEVVYHYSDIFRPAAVTYGRYKLVFITQSDGELSIYHDPPMVYDIESDPSETTSIRLEQLPPNLIPTVTAMIEKHLRNRTDKGISQFDYPFLTFHFPCASLPGCHKVNTEEDDFKKLLDD